MECPKCGKELQVIEYCECGWRGEAAGEAVTEEELLERGVMI